VTKLAMPSTSEKQRPRPWIIAVAVGLLASGLFWWLYEGGFTSLASETNQLPPDWTPGGEKLALEWTQLPHPTGGLSRELPGGGFIRDGDRVLLYTSETDRTGQLERPMPASLVGIASTGLPVSNDMEAFAKLGPSAVIGPTLWAIELPISDDAPTLLQTFDMETFQHLRTVTLDPDASGLAATRNLKRHFLGSPSPGDRRDRYLELIPGDGNTMYLIAQADVGSPLQLLHLDLATGKALSLKPMTRDKKGASLQEMRRSRHPVVPSVWFQEPLAIETGTGTYSMLPKQRSQGHQSKEAEEVGKPPAGYLDRPAITYWDLSSPPLCLRQTNWYPAMPLKWQRIDQQHTPHYLPPWRAQGSLTPMEGLIPQPDYRTFQEREDLTRLLGEVSLGNQQSWVHHGGMPMELFAVDGETAIIVQAIHPVLTSVSPTNGVLRIGILSTDAPRFTWIGWTPLPKVKDLDSKLWLQCEMSIGIETSLLCIWLTETSPDIHDYRQYDPPFVGYTAFATPPELRDKWEGWLRTSRRITPTS